MKKRTESNDLNQTLEEISEMVKIEKIHDTGEKSYFDIIADNIEIEIRDCLVDESVLSTKDKITEPDKPKKKFVLAKGQHIIFELPSPYMILYRGERSYENEIKEQDIDIKVIPKTVKKRKLSAKEKYRRKRNILFYKLGRTVALAILLFSLGMIGEQIYGYVSDYEVDKQIKEKFIGGHSPVVTPDRSVPAYPEATPVRLTYPDKIQLAELQELEKVSKDFRFWLYVDKSKIDYHVMQAKDNVFYLKHNIEGVKNDSGSIFLDYRNNPERIYGSKKESIGSNNIIYGHNMKNGSMFGLLRKFMDKDYFYEHQNIYTYSTKGVTVWKVFSAYETTTDDYYIQTYFSSSDEFNDFIKDLQKKSVVDTDIILKSKDDILTLSTCHRFTINNGRFVVHAVKIGTVPIT